MATIHIVPQKLDVFKRVINGDIMYTIMLAPKDQGDTASLTFDETGILSFYNAIENIVADIPAKPKKQT